MFFKTGQEETRPVIQLSPLSAVLAAVVALVLAGMTGQLVSVRKRPFFAISASICNFACAA